MATKPIVVIFPIAAILGVFALRRDVTDLVQAILSFSLAFGLNGLITDIVKLSVGKSFCYRLYESLVFLRFFSLAYT